MQRFNDLNAVENPALVHTVEISEAHDARQFFTLWLKGKRPGAADWAAAKKLPTKHDPEIYHAGPGNYGWMPAVFPEGPSSGWSLHFHVDLAAPPCWADFTPYLDQIPEALQDAVYAFVGPLRHPATQTSDLPPVGADGAEAGPDDGIVWQPTPEDVIDVLPMVAGGLAEDCPPVAGGEPDVAADTPTPKRKRRGRRKVDPLEQPDDEGGDQ